MISFLIKLAGVTKSYATFNAPPRVTGCVILAQRSHLGCELNFNLHSVTAYILIFLNYFLNYFYYTYFFEKKSQFYIYYYLFLQLEYTQIFSYLFFSSSLNTLNLMPRLCYAFFLIKCYSLCHCILLSFYFVLVITLNTNS